MSSNNPYGAQWAEGGPQPPMPGRAPSPSQGAGQEPSPYGYPPQTGGTHPQQPGVGSPDTASGGYSFGPFAPDQQQTDWGDATQPGPYGGSGGQYGAAPMPPAPPSKNKAKILIIIGAAALAVILIAVIAVVVATTGRQRRPAGRPRQPADKSIAKRCTAASGTALRCGGCLSASSCRW